MQSIFLHQILPNKLAMQTSCLLFKTVEKRSNAVYTRRRLFFHT